MSPFKKKIQRFFSIFYIQKLLHLLQSHSNAFLNYFMKGVNNICIQNLNVQRRLLVANLQLLVLEVYAFFYSLAQTCYLSTIPNLHNLIIALYPQTTHIVQKLTVIIQGDTFLFMGSKMKCMSPVGLWAVADLLTVRSHCLWVDSQRASHFGESMPCVNSTAVSCHVTSKLL